jgi:hypothetical protein
MAQIEDKQAPIVPLGSFQTDRVPRPPFGGQTAEVDKVAGGGRRRRRGVKGIRDVVFRRDIGKVGAQGSFLF